jgi:hypothetical protein
MQEDFIMGLTKEQIAERAAAKEHAEDTAAETTPETVTLTAEQYKALMDRLEEKKSVQGGNVEKPVSSKKEDFHRDKEGNKLTPHQYETAREVARLNERVQVILMKDNDNYKAPMSPQINGYTTVVERGVPLMVTRAVAENLKHASDQMMLADKMALDLANVFIGER